MHPFVCFFVSFYEQLTSAVKISNVISTKVFSGYLYDKPIANTIIDENAMEIEHVSTTSPNRDTNGLKVAVFIGLAIARGILSIFENFSCIFLVSTKITAPALMSVVFCQKTTKVTCIFVLNIQSKMGLIVILFVGFIYKTFNLSMAVNQIGFKRFVFIIILIVTMITTMSMLNRFFTVCCCFTYTICLSLDRVCDG